MKLLIWCAASVLPLWSAALTVSDRATSLPTPAPSEDALIMQAVLSELDGKTALSRDMYEKLFTLTGNKEYLVREARNALVEKKDQARSIANLTHWVTRHPTDHDKTLYLVLAALYIQTNALTEADEIVDAYLTKGEVDSEDLEEFGMLKIQLGEYDDALGLFQKAYAQTSEERTALQITALYLLHLKQPQKAITTLEKHIADDPDASVATYFKLIEMYAKSLQLDKVLDLYKKLYRKDPQKYFLQKIIEISLYQKDTDGLIRFLESSKENNDLLYGIYKDNGMFEKAQMQARKLYAKTHAPRWLSEQAILVYEIAQKSHQVTPEVLARMSQLFEQAFSEGDKEGIYLNFYGYTLIDHDVNVDKGIGMVRRALGKDPSNSYFLDSLAWGLYKKGECKNAYILMRRVVKQEGLKEKEINDHLKAIKACLKQHR
jgi:tetratricopeptide (TPR) repeat protein